MWSTKANSKRCSPDDLEFNSASTNHVAENPLTADLVLWAGTLLDTEKANRGKLQRDFRAALAGERVI